MNNIELYQKIKASVGAKWMPDLSSESVSIETDNVTQQRVWHRVAEFAPVSGWIQTLDRTGLLKDFDITTELSNPQAILCAELINGGGQSLHIRQKNRKELQLLTFRAGEGEEFFYTDAQHQIKSKGQKGTATYRLYWSMDKTSRQAKLSRIIAIEER